MDILAVGIFVTLFIAFVPQGIGKAITLVVAPPLIGLAVGGFLWTVSLFIFGAPGSWSSLGVSLLSYVAVSTFVIFGITLWGLYFTKE